METEPLERIDEHQSGETPEDVAILYSWANLQGAKYRDFSANRREYRAQMRHRAAEQLRLMELRAQSEAEAAATHAEAEAAAAHAEADAATVKLAVSRSMPSAAPDEILREKEVEELRRSSLREAAQQARRAASERLEAARRAEAAALADSIARREEREIAEAQASALRQAAQYHDSELRSRQIMAQHPEDQVPGRISDPYSPQILAEGAYYDGPGTPPSELEASRFRTQREYIERSTGAELPPFKMPPHFSEDRPDDRLPYRPRPESNRDLRQSAPEAFPDATPRRLAEMSPADREYFAERQLREERNASIPPKQWPGRQEQEALHVAAPRARMAAPTNRYTEPRDPYSDTPRYADALHYTDAPHYADAPRQPRAEVVSRIPDRHAEAHLWQNAPSSAEIDAEIKARREYRRETPFDGSLVNEESVIPRRSQAEFVQEPMRSERDWAGHQDDPWQPRRNGVPPAIDDAQRAAEERRMDEERHSPRPQLYSATPRPSGSWLREISAREAGGAPRREPNVAPAPVLPPTSDTSRERHSPRPSVEATYDNGRNGAADEIDKQPSGFRPPWLTQAQAPRPSGSRRVSETPVAAEKPTPRWLYPEQSATPVSMPESAAMPMVNQRVAPAAESRAEIGNTLQGSQEKVASRWFALKGVFARPDVTEPVERQAPRDKKHTTPIVAVYSLAGGVGKTSLVATLGRALSSVSEKVLLVDTTSHGLLPFYFGANELAPGTVRTFTPPSGSADAPIHLVSYDMDYRGSDGPSHTALIDGLLASSQKVNRVLLDLDGNCGWMIERLARLKPTILVPVAADMNSIVSLQAVEKKFAALQSADGEPLRPVYLLNQFDASLPLHVDLREVLRQQLGDRLLPFVIRRATGISEALAEGMTIVDYDPDSSATQDFLGLANWIRAVSAPTAVGFRNLRWSEQ